MESVRKKSLVVLACGTGSLFLKIVEATEKKILPAEVVGLISCNSQALVLKKAEEKNIKSHVLELKKFSNFFEWDKALCSLLKEKKPSLILLAGFLKKIGPQVLSEFKNRLINIHPSLLPRYGGEGMYGLHVHQAVIAKGDKKTGISIHLVGEEYDTGPLLAQKEIEVSPKDTAHSLQEKVKKEEQTFYISVLQKILKKEIKLTQET